jgi:hypothetical protein
MTLVPNTPADDEVLLQLKQTVARFNGYCRENIEPILRGLDHYSSLMEKVHSLTSLSQIFHTFHLQYRFDIHSELQEHRQSGSNSSPCRTSTPFSTTSPQPEKIRQFSFLSWILSLRRTFDLLADDLTGMSGYAALYAEHSSHVAIPGVTKDQYISHSGTIQWRS